MKGEIKLWFPNYGVNPGILSKKLRKEISVQIEDLDIEITKTYFKGFEDFILEVEYTDDSYFDYAKNILAKRFGNFTDPEDVSAGDVILGRLSDPGKIGFGIFVDIGIREGDKGPQDVLIPLYQLRDDLVDSKKYSAREIIDQFWLINRLPIQYKVISVEKDPKNDRIKISGGFAPETLEMFAKWEKKRVERLIIGKTFIEKIESLILDLDLPKYIQSIDRIDPLTNVVVCKKRTRASGLIGRLGSRLYSAPIGIYKPSLE